MWIASDWLMLLCTKYRRDHWFGKCAPLTRRAFDLNFNNIFNEIFRPIHLRKRSWRFGVVKEFSIEPNWTRIIYSFGFHVFEYDGWTNRRGKTEVNTSNERGKKDQKNFHHGLKIENTLDWSTTVAPRHTRTRYEF